ncbi:acyl-CoA dehydrogenase family protein [Nocardioides sp. Bht2]|uniref:acyl-CoA dehydrogenase family protein n=1 Tax=Nocardioides sp. Bht2 TaxID=3392297 RepID=UPI0039B3C0C8
MSAPTSPYPFSDLEQRLLSDIDKLASEFALRAPELDAAAELPIENLHALHAAGIDRAFLPRALGGDGISYLAFGEIVRTLAAACPSTATIWVMHSGAGIGLAQLTRDSQGTFFADEFLAGKRFANALSEPTSGNQFLNPQQAAEPVPGGFRLDGAKRFVSGSEVADYLLVNASVAGEPAFFAVIPDETVSIIPIWDTLGLRATRSQLLSFEATVLRAELRGRAMGPGDINPIGAGLPMISLGIADAALAAAVAHAQQRIILDAPLSHQQWVQHEIADVHARLEAAHAFTQIALWRSESGDPGALGALGTAKYLANKIAVDAAQLGVRIGGGSGFLRSSPIQRHLRDAQAGQLMAHSTEVLATLIGQQVLGVAQVGA